MGAPWAAVGKGCDVTNSADRRGDRQGRPSPPGRGGGEGRAGEGARGAGGRQPRRGEGGAPDQPFRPHRAPTPAKPALPEERPHLDREVYRELRSAARPGDAEDVLRAYAAAGDALVEGDLDRAITVLEWAKSAAARSGAIREALGVARYRAGDFAAAHSELLAYRRLSGRQDQNHLLADCARAAGRPDKVAEYVAAMDPATVPADRIAEGILVLAGDRADRGDIDGALRMLERADLEPADVQEHHVRLWYLAADLSERAGDHDAGRDYLEAIHAVDPDYLDVADRLAEREG